MSKIYPVIKEAKIVNSEYNKPEKQFDQKTGEFKYFHFDICPILSKKNAKGEWENKIMQIRCTIWNESLAEKFLSIFDSTLKNYITILDGTLTDFNIDQIQKTSQQGKDYNVNVYSYLSMTVNDFVMTSKPMNDESERIEVIEQDQKEMKNEDNIVDEKIPF